MEQPGQGGIKWAQYTMTVSMSWCIGKILVCSWYMGVLIIEFSRSFSFSWHFKRKKQDNLRPKTTLLAGKEHI